MPALRMLSRTHHPTISLLSDQAPESPDEGVLLMPVPLLDGEPAKPRPCSKKQQRFMVRSMYKYELATWYGETKRRFSALYFRPVLAKLKKVGYTSHTKLLTRSMVAIIVAHHGEPDSDSAN